MYDLVGFFQDTDQEDQTYLDEFQECLEEYQECLEVVQICIEDDVSFNHSSCDTQPSTELNSTVFLNVDIEGNAKTEDSELDLSYKSTCDRSDTNDNIIKLTKKHFDSLEKTDSVKETSEKDGYETCVDESFSDENKDKTPTNSNANLCQSQVTNFASSEPCLTKSDFGKVNHICLDGSKDELNYVDSVCGDEFFLL